MRSVIYARYSSDRQSEAAITDQIEVCPHYVERQESTVTETHSDAAIKGPHGGLKRAIENALLLRGSHDFDDLASYRGFVDAIVGRRNTRNAKRTESERARAAVSV